MRATIAWVALLGAAMSSVAGAQEHRAKQDAEVQAAALLEIIKADLGHHPAGPVRTLCVGPEAMPSSHDTVAPGDLSLVRSQLARETGLTVSRPDACVNQPAPAFGTLIVDRAHGAPALLVGVVAPRAIAPDTMEVLVSSRAGGRWGRGERCTVAKRGVHWAVAQCLLTWRS
jgi:hypothetical protein